MNKASEARKVVIWFIVGLAFLQTAWIAAVPPFRGIDEFDHAYRAAATADGQWKPAYVSAENGRGELLRVPADLVSAASAVCETYEYVGPDNCNPVRHYEDGSVLVASAAARYNPAFYWLIGTASAGTSGADALYVMRLATALIAVGLLGCAGLACVRVGQSSWVLVGLVTAGTPVLIYSTAVVAPNGIEMAAGLALWACLISLKHASSREARTLILWATPSAVVVAGVRQLGPLWLGLTVLTVGLYLGWPTIRKICHDHKLTLAIVGATLCLVAAWNVHWTLTAGALSSSKNLGLSDPLTSALEKLPLWFFQSVAAYPMRDDAAHPLVYALFIPPVAAMWFVAISVAAGSGRRALIACCAASVAVPVLITAATYSKLGAEWQGRYGLPYSVGLMLMSAYVLQRHMERSRFGRAYVYLVVGLVAISHVVGVSALHVEELQQSPLADTVLWRVQGVAVITSVALLGAACWLLASFHAVREYSRGQSSAEPNWSAPPRAEARRVVLRDPVRGNAKRLAR